MSQPGHNEPRYQADPYHQADAQYQEDPPSQADSQYRGEPRSQDPRYRQDPYPAPAAAPATRPGRPPRGGSRSAPARPARGHPGAARPPRAGARGGAGDDRQARGRRDRRSVEARRQAQAREIRWHNNRLAVPYYTDGPKVTLGVLWFLIMVAAIVTSPLAVAVVAAAVAALAGLQTGLAWFPQHPITKGWTAAAAFVAGLGGALGPLGIVTGAVLGALLVLIYIALNPVHSRPTPQLLDVLLRSSIPVGVAAGSLAALCGIDLGAALLLVALVSAYEIGDFLIGSGSSNAVEGPLSGLVALAAVGFVAWILAPAPFTRSSVMMFAALAGVCCPLGQILAAALLPRGSAWAPALRRLDSYLLAAPLWLLLLSGLSSSSTL